MKLSTQNKKKLFFGFTIVAGLIFSFITGFVVHCNFDEMFDDVDVQSKVGEHYDNKREDIKAYKWYMKAAKRGDPMAQNNLGVLYTEGTGIKQDYKKAIKWYTKAE
jgi:TPR repeat protein